MKVDFPPPPPQTKISRLNQPEHACMVRVGITNIINVIK